MIALDVGTTETPPPQFEEAVRWFRGRVPMTQAVYDALAAEAQRRAFTLAGAAALAVVSEVWRSLDATLTEGRTLRDFKRDVAPGLLAQWGGTVASPAWRMEVIFRNATQRAYVHGRVEQLRDPAVARTRPFWFFDAIGDARTSEICKALDGTVLRASDPWWASHTPPCHHACRSTIRGLRANDPRVAAAGPAPDTEAQAGFGVLPEADDWTPREGDYPSDVWAAYQSNPQAYRAPAAPVRRPATQAMPAMPVRPTTAPRSPVESAELWVAGRSGDPAIVFDRLGTTAVDVERGASGDLDPDSVVRHAARDGVLVVGRKQGSAPSIDDIAVADRLGLSEIRVVSVVDGNASVTTLARPAGGWVVPSRDDVRERVDADLESEKKWSTIRRTPKQWAEWRSKRESEVVAFSSGVTPSTRVAAKAEDARKEKKPKVYKRNPSAALPKSFASHLEAEMWLAEKYPSIRFDLDGVHPSLLRSVASSWHENARDWPEAASALEYVGTYKNRRGTIEDAHIAHVRNGVELALNPRYYGDRARFEETARRCVKSGFLVGTEDASAEQAAAHTVDHEFGHVLKNWIEGAGRRRNFAPSRADGFGNVADTLSLFHSKNAPTARLSRYALTNDHEAFAESYAAIRGLPKSKWTQYTRRHHALLEITRNAPVAPLVEFYNLRGKERDAAIAEWERVADMIGLR